MYEPVTHCLQLNCESEPIIVEKVPPRHEMQLADVTAYSDVEYAPAWHSTHDDDPGPRVYEPTGHGLHVDEKLTPNADEYVPLEHA